MPVIDSEIKFYLTGASSDGGVQVIPNASLGDYRSSTEIVDAVQENLFDNVSNYEAVNGDIEYRCYCIKNTNSIDSLNTAVIWIETDTGFSDQDISFAVEVPTGDDQTGNAQTIASESTSPIVGSGNVSAWSDAISKATGVGVDQGSHDANLDAGEIVYIWLRRDISVNTGIRPGTAIIKIEGNI